MTRCLIPLAAALAVANATLLMAQTPPPPVAAQKPHVVTSPHGDRQDPYYWLRDDTRKSPDLEHLKAENAYTEALLAPVKGLREQLFKELKGRIKPDDEQPAWRMRDLSSSRFLAGKDYAVNVRRPAAGGDSRSWSTRTHWQPGTATSRWASGTSRSTTPGWRTRPTRWAAAQYVIEFKDIATGKLYPEKLTGTSGNVAWADDNKTLFYVENDPVTLLAVRVRAHVLGRLTQKWTRSCTRNSTRATTWS